MPSHQVAVNAYLIHNREFLLLKRVRPPLLWGPPGGRLRENEDPLTGLQREVAEETGLNVTIHQPVTTWFGVFNSDPLLSIDYLCTVDHRAIRLSDEHSHYKWFGFRELYQQRDTLFTSRFGFQFSDYLQAWLTYLYFIQEWKEIKDIYADQILKKYLPIQKLSIPG